MAWNEPSNNGRDRNPWGNSKKDQSPPDLDELFKQLGKRFGGFWGNKNGSGSSMNFSFIGLIAVLLAVVWFVSGFYTIKESEKGVVLRFGQYYKTAEPGLSWKATFIDEVFPVDVESVRSLQASGFMLTQDENLVRVQLDVQYQVYDPRAYLFNVVQPDDSLKQATDSALRYVIGHNTMDDVLTTGRESVRYRTRELLDDIIEPYQMGLRLVDVNLLPARPPDEVKHAFDDATAAKEDEQQYIRTAEAYELSKRPEARAKAQAIIDAAQAQREQAILRARGEVARYEALLPEYLAAPELTRRRLYIEMMESVYQNSAKIMVDTPEGGQNLLYLPIDKLMQSLPKTGQLTEPKSNDGALSPGHEQSGSAGNTSTSLGTFRQHDRFSSRGESR